MNILTHIPSWLKNKYFIALGIFAIVLLFADKNDLYTQYERRKEYNGLLQSKKYYSQEIERLQKIREQLKNDPAAIEKFARENYYMKRENEEIFLIPGEKQAN